MQNSAIANINQGQTSFDSLGSTFRKIWRNEGLLGLFKGNGTNIIRIIPYSSMQFASYEFFLKVHSDLLLTSHSSIGQRISTRNESIKTWQRLTAGACAGIIAATFTYPLDLIRTRLSLASETRQNLGVLRTLTNVVRNEGGFPALYRGLSPTLMVSDNLDQDHNLVRESPLLSQSISPFTKG